ncbi:STAS domain-containing protein [Methanobrevibacter sp.]|uniref:STAS domain-containing protein n=1 Tax=Methanobrevibacter sp. TaxID=66852 RepID=UPI003D7D3D03
MNMEIIDNKNGNELKIKLVGKLDTNTSPQLEEFIQNNIEDVEKLVYDFEELLYISSSGLRVLLSSQKIMNTQGEMEINNVNEFVMEVFEATGFTDIMNIN